MFKCDVLVSELSAWFYICLFEPSHIICFRVFTFCVVGCDCVALRCFLFCSLAVWATDCDFESSVAYTAFAVCLLISRMLRSGVRYNLWSDCAFSACCIVRVGFSLEFSACRWIVVVR